MVELIYAIAIAVGLLALLLTNFICSVLYSVVYGQADPRSPETVGGKELIRRAVLLAIFGFIVGNLMFYFAAPPAWTERVPAFLLASTLPLASLGVFALAINRIKTRSDQQEFPGFLTLTGVLLWFFFVPLLYRPLVPSYSGDIFGEIQTGQEKLREGAAALPWSKPGVEPHPPGPVPTAVATPLPTPKAQPVSVPTVAPFPIRQPSQEMIDALIGTTPPATPAVMPDSSPAATPDPSSEFAKARRSEPFANPYVSSCANFGAFRQPPRSQQAGAPVDLQYLSNSDHTISFKWRCPGGENVSAFFTYFCCSCSDGASRNGEPAPGGVYRLTVEPGQDYAWMAACEKPYSGSNSNYHVARLAKPGTRSYFRSYSFPRVETSKNENKRR